MAGTNGANHRSLPELLKGLQCPRCGRVDTYEVREIDFTERVAGDTVTVKVLAGVCSNCGEELLDDTATEAITVAVNRLKAGDVASLARTGSAYRYP
jgi:YgiT-type zinc finger domain-containing protein